MYRVETIIEKSIEEIVGIGKKKRYEVIFDAREIKDETRGTVTPKEIASLCSKNDLMYIDQLVFGEDSCPEIIYPKKDEISKWWTELFLRWSDTMNIIFITSATREEINKGECLATRFIEEFRDY